MIGSLRASLKRHPTLRLLTKGPCPSEPVPTACQGRPGPGPLPAFLPPAPPPGASAPAAARPTGQHPALHPEDVVSPPRRRTGPGRVRWRGGTLRARPPPGALPAARTDTLVDLGEVGVILAGITPTLPRSTARRGRAPGARPPIAPQRPHRSQGRGRKLHHSSGHDPGPGLRPPPPPRPHRTPAPADSKAGQTPWTGVPLCRPVPPRPIAPARPAADSAVTGTSRLRHRRLPGDHPHARRPAAASDTPAPSSSSLLPTPATGGPPPGQGP